MSTYLKLALLLPAVASLALSCGHSTSTSRTPSPTEVVDTALPLTQDGAVPAVPDPVEVYVMKVDGQPRLITTLSDDPMWAWAPDDDHAALVTNAGTGSAKIHVISVKAGTETATVDIAGFPRRFTWSPNGEWLAWETYDLHTDIVEVMRADGSDRKTLGSGTPWTDYGDVFAWKDDNTLLASLWEGESNEPGVGTEPANYELFEFDLASGSQHEFTQPKYATAAELSPDASRVVFVALGSLWVMDVSDGNLRQVLSDTHLRNDASWSPDGSQIAYGVGGSEDTRGIYILDLASGTSRKLVSFSTLFDGVVRWSPDSSAVVAYRSECADPVCPKTLSDLALIPVAGGDESVISSRGPHSLSPNGGSVAFDKDGLQVVQIPDGTARQAMAADPDWQFNLLGWSPDGQWFSFARSHSWGVRRQFEVNADGSGLKRLENLEGPTPTPSAEDLQVPSPDGRRVAVVAWPMHIRDADGANEVSFDGIFGSQLVWSPDSKRLVFSSDCPLYSVKDVAPLLLVNADGSGLAPLTNGSPPDCGPAFSPDGKKVAFVRMEGDTQQVMTIDVNTREEEALLTVDVEYELSGVGPVWSPNGSLLALCVEGVGIYVIRADGSGGQQIVATDWVSTDWSWGRGHSPLMRWQSDSVLYFVSGSGLD